MADPVLLTTSLQHLDSRSLNPNPPHFISFIAQHHDQHWHQYWHPDLCLRVYFLSCVGQCLVFFPFAHSMVILFQDQNSLSLSSSSKCGNPVRQSPCRISSQTSLLPPPPYVDGQTVSQSATAATFVERSEPAERRFFKALLIALLICVLLGIFVSAVFGLPNSTRRVSFRQGALGFVMLKTGHREE